MERRCDVVEADKKYIKNLIDIIDRPDIIRCLRIVIEDVVKEVYGEAQKEGEKCHEQLSGTDSRGISQEDK